jgi:tRNA(fMet)-specific endonuclease VapC
VIWPIFAGRAGVAAMYLFDTDTISNIFKPVPSATLLTRLAGVEQRHQYIATTTIAEIVYGAWKSNRPRYHLDNLEKILLPAVNILSFDSKAAYACGTIRARMAKEGTALALADLEIAAIAIANGFILVTGNTRHFARIPDLVVENWIV